MPTVLWGGLWPRVDRVGGGPRLWWTALGWIASEMVPLDKRTSCKCSEAIAVRNLAFILEGREELDGLRADSDENVSRVTKECCRRITPRFACNGSPMRDLAGLDHWRMSHERSPGFTRVFCRLTHELRGEPGLAPDFCRLTHDPVGKPGPALDFCRLTHNSCGKPGSAPTFRQTTRDLRVEPGSTLGFRRLTRDSSRRPGKASEFCRLTHNSCGKPGQTCIECRSARHRTSGDQASGGQTEPLLSQAIASFG